MIPNKIVLQQVRIYTYVSFFCNSKEHTPPSLRLPFVFIVCLNSLVIIFYAVKTIIKKAPTITVINKLLFVYYRVALRDPR